MRTTSSSASDHFIAAAYSALAAGKVTFLVEEGSCRMAITRHAAGTATRATGGHISTAAHPVSRIIAFFQQYAL